MIRSLLLLLILCIVTSFIGKAQNEIQNIVPLSPNAAAFSKYGEIPVSNFTGVPNISIPIYDIKSNSLNLPIYLSYHASGNKVESIASWVGLGWTLNTIPSISRSVRGIPDEDGGYFSKYTGKTVKELYDQNEAGNSTLYNQFLVDVKSGTADPEADIFYYSIAGESGKFFYNQDTDQFITIPNTNVLIYRIGLGFNLISEDGVEYTFDVNEQTLATASGSGNPVTTAWYVSKMLSANTKDSINFSYELETTNFNTKTAITKYQYIAGDPNAGQLSGVAESINTNNQVTGRQLSKISFDGGYVAFDRITTGLEREDLTGGYSLKHLSVFTDDNVLVKKFTLEYSYFQGGGCLFESDQSKKWLLLKKLKRVSSSSAPSSLTPITHEFKYKESGVPPCRVSPAQDFWGYYNGQTTNEDLIPTTLIPGTNPPLNVPGANRQVDPIKSQFGILTEIIYPTGGRTEFFYENNEGFAQDLQLTYKPIDIPIYLGGDGGVNGEPPPGTQGLGTPQDPYFVTFIMDNPPDEYLNGLNDNGGAFIDIQIIAPTGCDLSNGTAECAVYRLKGISERNSFVNYTIDADTRFYIPNGEYKISASFTPEITDYSDFYYEITYEEIDIGPGEEAIRYAGGLRIQEIRTYSNNNPAPIIKRYSYKQDINSLISSGNVFGDPRLIFSDVIEYQHHQQIDQATATYYAYYLRMKSYSNIQQISHSGAFMGYETVIEETDNIDETGLSVYKYSNVRDISDGAFPHPPPVSQEVYRGQLKEVAHYKKEGLDLLPVEKATYEYDDQPFLGNAAATIISSSLKGGDKILTNDPNYIIGLHNKPQVVVLYETKSSWSALSKDSVQSYFQGNILKKVTDYFYDNPDHLQLTRTQTIDSEGQVLKTITQYPQDISVKSLAEQELITQNRIAIPIQIETWKENTKLSTQRTNYNEWYPKIIEPQTIQLGYGTDPLIDQVKYHGFYNNGKPQEISKSDDINVVYIWSYNYVYPIAQVENATFPEISNAMNIVSSTFIADLGVEVNQTVIETKLNQLRNQLSQDLPNALTTTFMYDPLVGMTSQTDPNGITVFYEYDEFNRLKLIKDHEGNILQHYEYHYKNQ